jgi:hypothetical protein
VLKFHLKSLRILYRLVKCFSQDPAILIEKGRRYLMNPNFGV